LNDADVSRLQHEINEIQSLLATIHPVMPRLKVYLLSRRDNFITQLVDHNDEVTRGRIQELQALIGLQEILERQITYRTAEINRADDSTTGLTGLDAISGDFLQ
jgi:hypothetical protein